jgi:hypothetical protein
VVGSQRIDAQAVVVIVDLSAGEGDRLATDGFDDAGAGCQIVGVHAVDEAEGGEYAVVLRQRQLARIDDAVVRLQRPVAAEPGGAGQVGRGGDIGARGLGDAVQQLGAAAARGHVAAVQQQIAVGRQCAAESGQLGLRGGR